MLEQIEVPFSVRPVVVDESVREGESASVYVMRLARAKARAVVDVAVPVLAADTAVVVDGRIYGKPADQAQGVEMLLALSDRDHEVVTGVVMRLGSRETSRLATATVTFREVDRGEAVAYWHTGEAADKAGGYGIQGIGGIFVSRISGSYGAIVGLPLEETHELLRSFNVDTWQFRAVQSTSS